MSKANSILIVDDDARMRNSLATILDQDDYQTRTAKSGYEAIDIIEKYKFDIVVLDICMEGVDGFEVMKKMAGHQNDTRFIMMTGYDSKERAVRAFKSGACYFLRKPFDPDEFLKIIEFILAGKRETDLLRLSEELHSHLAENARDMIYRMSLPDGQYEYVNSASREILGYSPEEFYNEPLLIRKIIHPKWHGYFEKQWALLLSGDPPDVYEYQIVHKDGDERWLHQRNHLIRGEAGRPIAIEGIVSDITQRKAYEKKLKESEAKFRGLFDLSPIPIAVSELSTGRFVDVNDELCRFSNYSKEELIGKGSTEIGVYTASDRDRFTKALGSSGEVKGMEMDFKIKDGTFRSTLMFSKIIRGEDERYIITAIYDRTDRKNLEAQTQLVQRLEAIATLSGGIAHQFNNALQAVVGNIELLELELPDNEKVKKFSRRTSASTERMAHLVNQLLAYARSGKYKSEVVNLSNFVRSTLPDVTPDKSTNISIETNLSKDISDIHADKNQLQMVLTAVLINAIEAMEDKGRVVISSGNEEISEAFAARHPGLRAGSYASLKIKDDGKGMDEETKNRIFEPFFTTKSRGRGLGMAAVYGIIKNHSGYVLVDSEPGKGTIVCILIPRQRR